MTIKNTTGQLPKDDSEISDFFPRTTVTKEELKNRTGKTPSQVYCPFMEQAFLGKFDINLAYKVYLVSGICSIGENRICEYIVSNFDPKKCNTGITETRRIEHKYQPPSAELPQSFYEKNNG